MKSVLQAIDFLHTRALISHNNIDISSFFVDSRKKWKLGLFEFSCKFTELSQHRLEVLEIIKNKNEDQNAIEYIESAGHGYDIYCFSRTVIELLSKFDFKIPDLKTVLERSGLHASPKQRPSAAQLLKHSVFKSPFAHIVSFLSDYVLKSDAERFRFFNEFPSLAREISEEVLCSSVIPLVLVPSVFTDFPTKSLVHHFLTPYKEGSSVGLVSEAAFTRLVVPQISRLFRCHELTTRMLLLQHFQTYARLMGRETLKTIVLPEVCMGVYDTNEDLAAASLSCLAHLAHLLGTALVMSHFGSLGAQMESRGFLAPAPLSNSDKTALSTYTTLAINPTKKPLVYAASKRPWRLARATFFPDSAPKADRQAREPPVEITNGTEGAKTNRLADMAMLSANYVPMAAPVKRVPNGPSIVKKLSSPKPIGNPRSFSSIFPPTKEQETSAKDSNSLPEETSTRALANGIKLASSPPPSDKTRIIESDSTITPAHSPVTAPPNTTDDGDDQWNHWSSDTEDDKPTARTASTISLKSLSLSLSKEEADLKEREAKVEALLAELEPKIAPRRPLTSPSQSALESGDLALTSASLTPSSASLQYKVENTSGDLGTGDDEEGDDGWNVEDEDF
ncbi:hypothetical protein Aperf_G00000129609 [Anoplocephala perfoliata]